MIPASADALSDGGANPVWEPGAMSSQPMGGWI